MRNRGASPAEQGACNQIGNGIPEAITEVSGLLLQSREPQRFHCTSVVGYVHRTTRTLRALRGGRTVWSEWVTMGSSKGDRNLADVKLSLDCFDNSEKCSVAG